MSHTYFPNFFFQVQTIKTQGMLLKISLLCRCYKTNNRLIHRLFNEKIDVKGLNHPLHSYHFNKVGASVNTYKHLAYGKFGQV